MYVARVTLNSFKMFCKVIYIYVAILIPLLRTVTTNSNIESQKFVAT